MKSIHGGNFEKRSCGKWIFHSLLGSESKAYDSCCPVTNDVLVDKEHGGLFLMDIYPWDFVSFRPNWP